ncbi:MAG: lysostaphin resistance A-like protein [Atopobiaceae bacterium]
MLLPKTYLVCMKEQERYRWWKPIVCFLLAGLLYAVFSVIAMFALGASGILSPFEVLMAQSGDLTTDDLMNEAMQLMTGSGLGIALLLVLVILLLPALWIAMNAARLGGFRTLSSVEGHLRWKRIGRLIVPVLLVFAIGNAAELAIACILSGEVPALSIPSLSYILAILVLVPFQSAAEEYAYRGFLMQTFGSWIPVAVIPLVLQALIFMGSHTYNIWGLLAILVFGLIGGILALQTGGLEASIAFHASNNICAFLFSALLGANALAADATPLDMALSVALDIVVFFVILHIAKKQGWLLGKDSQPAVPASEPAPQHMKQE